MHVLFCLVYVIGVGNVGGVIELSIELNFFNLARNW